MSVRNLDSMYKPKSIALIGASQKPGKIGTVVTRNLIGASFQGDIYPVNPKYEEIEGLRVYPDVSSLPRAADLAVIATPPDTVPALIRQLGEKGTKAAVVITAGFGESEDAQGKARQNQMLLAAQPHLLRIVGPNCLGIMVPRMSLNASFGHIPPLTGRIAFVAQSGAVLTSVLDWATAKQIGFSYFVSLGDMADVDFADMLDYLASDPHTHAVLLYIEAIQHARKFMSAARALARIKPVVVIKVGRYVESARVVASHTGALAGSDAVYDAAFRRSGVLRVDSLSELFGVVETLALTRPFTGDRLAILTNGGGIGVLATDSLIAHGGRLAELSRETIERLNEALPPTWSHGNPVDIIGDAPGSRYADALEALLRDPGVDAILTLNCPLAIASSLDAAEAVVRTAGKQRGTARTRGLLTSWLGATAAEPARRLFIENRIPTYETPTEAVRAYMHMVEYRRRQEMLMETPASVPETFRTNMASARAVVDQALQDGRNWLSEQEVRAVLNAYGVPTTECWYAGTPDDAAALAAKLSRSLALKINSPEILHKSDVGGVALNLDTPDAVRNAASSMLERIRGAAPTATVHGFSIQPMIRRPNAFELIVGMTVDQQFGPVLLFGHGGTAVEVIQDKTVALPPLNMHLAHEMMRHTRIYRLLEGYRDRPAADLNAVALTLVKISQLVCDIAAIVELDINPLLADQWGVVAVDARIRVAPSDAAPSARLAIRPYPKELEEVLELPDGSTLLLRPIRPEDEPAYHELFGRLPPEDVRLRFMQELRQLPHETAARLTQIDYDRQMAFVLEGKTGPSAGELFGSVQIDTEPNGEKAEFAILLRRDMAGKGLGPMLLRRIINYGKGRGLTEIYGEVLRENTAMRRLCEAFGFSSRVDPNDLGVVLVSLSL